MKILFFLESLHGGGKERRSVELIQYLIQQPAKYEIELVLTESEVHYEDIYKTSIPINILKRRGSKYDPGIFFRFFKICVRFKPDIIHCWGKMTTFYAIPSKVIRKIPLISSLISDSKKAYGSLSPYSFLLKTNVHFSDVVLSNSKSGLEAYNIKKDKARVIYNGVRLSRFLNDFDIEYVKRKFIIKTRFSVIMVANFSAFKDYDLFLDIARETGKVRNDVTFIAVGDGIEMERIRKRIANEDINNVLLTGKQLEVEPIVASSDIGILCTKSEGMSNSIIEYMALGKPVIATDMIGGSRELITNGITGYCTERDSGQVVELLNKLLDDNELRSTMGRKGMERIRNNFSIERMGEEFRALYNEVLSTKNLTETYLNTGS